MSLASLIRLSLASFFIVGALGPVMVLMQSEIRLMPWQTVILQTFACGGLGATVILVGRWRRWATLLVVFFWFAVMFVNSGGLDIIFTDQGTLRAELHGPSDISPRPQKPTDQPLTIPADQLSAIYTQRGVLGLIVIFFVAFGSSLMMRVIRKEVDQRARLETEMSIAQDIQQSLLPPGIHSTPWCKIAGRSLPAVEVGGDYFDVVPLADGRLALCVADVTGHGVGAGILSAMTKSAFLAELRHDPSPAALLRNLNETLIRVSSEKMFVTFAYALFDWPKRIVKIATAGHPPVLQRTTGGIVQHRTPSLALGLKSDISFQEIEATISAGEIFLFFTDGLVETMDARGEQFGVERLAEMIPESPAQPETVSGGVFRVLEHFRGHRDTADDVTLVVLSVNT